MKSSRRSSAKDNRKPRSVKTRKTQTKRISINKPGRPKAPKTSRLEISPEKRGVSSYSSRAKKGNSISPTKKRHIPTVRPMMRKIDMKAEADSEVHNLNTRPIMKSSKSKKPVRSSPRKSVQKYDDTE